MTEFLNKCVFAMKRLSDYTAGIIEPYKQSTIRKSTESFSEWNSRCNQRRDDDINTLIESLFFFINSEQERSKDSKRLDWIEKQFSVVDVNGEGENVFSWPDWYLVEGDPDPAPLRLAIDRTMEQEAIALQSDSTTQESSENQAGPQSETSPDSNGTERSEASPPS